MNKLCVKIGTKKYAYFDLGVSHTDNLGLISVIK